MKRVQKAPSQSITNEELKQLVYPVYGSVKMDGYRCVIDEVPLTSSLKPFPNEFVRATLSDPIFDGLDAEIVVGSLTDPNVFHNSSGPLRRSSGEPDFKLYAFDSWKDGGRTYYDRWITKRLPSHPRLVIVEQRLLSCADEVTRYERECLAEGHEGIMLRSGYSAYKEGRCTFNEMNIFKRKPTETVEAIIIGFEESMMNLNEKVINERGLSERSRHKENKRAKGTLGAFILKSEEWPDEFRSRAGEGFNDAKKQKIWDDRENLLGEKVLVKFQRYGSLNGPRQPSVIAIMEA